MMKFHPFIFALCLLVGCGKEQHTPKILVDDTFFTGIIGSDFFDVKNEFREEKIIKTIQESPSYNFIFSYTFDNRPIIKEVSTRTLNVNIPDAKEGEKYFISTEAPIIGVSQVGISCILQENTFNTDETQSKTYVPALNKSVHVVVNKVDINTVSNSKIITGQISGFLYNKLDLQDSIEIKADFKTMLYK